MMVFLKVLLIIAIVIAVFFLLTPFIYFFNLDMKIAAISQPIVNKWYDRYKRKPLP